MPAEILDNHDEDIEETEERNTSGYSFEDQETEDEPTVGHLE